MTYSGNPQASAKDLIRFLMQDTATPFAFSDTEITAMYALQGSDMARTLDSLCMAMVAKCASRPYDEAVEGLSTTWGDMASKYISLRRGFADMSQAGTLPTYDGQTATTASSQIAVLATAHRYAWEWMG